MHILGLSLMAVGVTGLLILAAEGAVSVVRSWLYRHEMDRWADEVPEWR